jgi:hypothetical protein
VDGVPIGAGGYVDGDIDPTQGFRFTDLTKENSRRSWRSAATASFNSPAQFEF